MTNIIMIQDVLRQAIGGMTKLGSDHKDVVEAADRTLKNLEAEALTILETERQRKQQAEVILPTSQEFVVRVNGGDAQTIKVATGIYMHAAMAVPALFGIHTPVDVEIWSPQLTPEHGPYFYRIEEDEFGGIRVKHLVRINK